jgi:hypothetical protein
MELGKNIQPVLQILEHSDYSKLPPKIVYVSTNVQSYLQAISFLQMSRRFKSLTKIIRESESSAQFRTFLATHYKSEVNSMKIGSLRVCSAVALTA